LEWLHVLGLRALATRTIDLMLAANEAAYVERNTKWAQ